MPPAFFGCPGPRGDPFITGLDDLFQIAVGQDFFRDERTGSNDFNGHDLLHIFMGERYFSVKIPCMRQEWEEVTNALFSTPHS